MGHFSIDSTGIDGLKIIQKRKLEDDRGHLSRMFCEDELRQLGWSGKVAQANHTLTRKKGAIRGLHLQLAPHAEIKLVTCLSGSVFDVAVDLRPQSPTYLKWVGCELSRENWKTYYIPEGFAHGFQTLSDDVEMLYFHSQAYAPDHEWGIHHQDPALAIDWPLDVTELSERDNELGSVKDYERKRP